MSFFRPNDSKFCAKNLVKLLHSGSSQGSSSVLPRNTSGSKVKFQIGVYLLQNVRVLRIELVVLRSLGRTEICVIGHKLCIIGVAYHRRCRLGIEHKESMNDILIHALKALPKPANPDKSRPCLTHRRLQPILSDFVFFECGRFVRQFRITANACYISTKIIPPPCTQGTKP